MLIIDIEKINEEVREITRTKYQEFVDEVYRVKNDNYTFYINAYNGEVIDLKSHIIY